MAFFHHCLRADVNGTTPLHVACYKGNTKLVCRMIDSGADLSLRNDVGDGVYEWASRNRKLKKQKAMTDFLERVQYYGELLTCYDKDEACPMKLPRSLKRPVSETSVIEMMGYKTAGVTSYSSLRSDESQGFGQVYPCPKESAGIVSVVPLISEIMLRNVTNVSYECSLDFTMREMMWIRTPVNVKQLNSEFEVHERAILILNEAEKFGKLRHPNILLFMALCQAKTLDMMTLVFECADQHNLYQVLHLDSRELSFEIQMKMTRQLCHVLEFIHKQDMIHCSLSSKAVYLTSVYDVKLGNFEFMMERSEADKCKSSPLHSYPPATWLYNWMAPEVMMGGAPTFSSDTFSYSCIVWEIFRGTVPWSWMSTAEHYKLVEAEKNIDLSVLLLPGPLYFLRESLKLKKEQRMGDMSTIGYMLKPLESSFSIFDRKNKSENAADDECDSPGLFLRAKQFGMQKTIKEDKLLFGTSDRDVQSMNGDHCQDRSSYSLPRENTITKQYSSIDVCPSSESRVHFQKSGKPESHMDHGWISSTKSEKTSRPNVRLKTSRRTDKSHMDGCLREVASLSVKELAKHYQQCLNQHKLRQAILKGSTIPHGSCPDLDSQSSSFKWNSLPATLRDSSKTWTLGNDDMERNASEVGDLSSTPVLKSCSTPEEKDCAANGGYIKTPTFKERRVKRHLFQQRLRDVGVCCNEIRQDDVYNERHNIFNDGMDVKSVSHPESLRRELVNEVRLFQSDASQPQSHWMSPDSGQVDGKKSKNVVRSVKDVKTTEDFFKTSQQESAGTDTPQSDISWDLTQVTPMEAAELTEIVKGSSQEKLNGQSRGLEVKQFTQASRFTKAPQKVSNLNLSPDKSKEKADDLETLNSTFIVEDETVEGEKTLSANVDPISCWVDSKLEDIRRKVIGQGSGNLHQTENDTNSSMDFDEEISKEVNQHFYMDDFHPSNLKTSELIEETGSNQISSICEFEFQEFYIDDDLNNEMKDHHGSLEKKENLNSHVNGNDQSRTAVPPISSIELRYEAKTEDKLPHGLPPPAVIKPKRRRIKWRKNMSQPATTSSCETNLLPIAKKRETFSDANLTSQIEHQSRCKGTGEINTCQAHLNLDSGERSEDQKGEPNLTSKLISLFEDAVKIEKVSRELKEPDGEGEKKSKKFEWNAEDVIVADTEVKRLNACFDSQYDKSKVRQSLCLDKSTDMDTENENIVFQRFQDQEIQVCCDYDNVESDEWVNEKLRIIQDKIKRRKHRLVYCISSDEDDAEDKQSDEEGAEVCFPDIRDTQRSQQMCSFKTLQALPSPTQKHSLSDGFTKGDSTSWPRKNGTDLGLQNDPSSPSDDLHKSEKPPKQDRFVSRIKRTLPDLPNFLNDKEEDKSIGKSDSTDCAESAIHDPVVSDIERESRPNLLDKVTSPSKGQRSPEAETLILRKVSFSNVGDQSPSNLSQQTSGTNRNYTKSHDRFNALPKWQILSETNSNINRSPEMICTQESQYLPRHLRPTRNYSDNEGCARDVKEISNTNSLQYQGEDIALVADYDQSQEHQKDHCLILDLRCPEDGLTASQFPSNRQKNQSGTHKFYLPKERWSNGCQARLHVQLSPTNPHKHHVTTTAFDPESGCSEILMEETLVTNNLKSSFNLQ